MSADWVTAIAAIFTGLVALYGVIVAKAQLGGIRDALRTDSLMAVLSIEAELAERKEKCDAISTQIKRLAGEPNMSVQELKLLKESLDLAVENWLNALDRLCFCINKSYVPEKDWRAEYRNHVANAISSQKHFFEADTKYAHILKLHKKWQAE